jgi:aspartate/methionine/tyrosine aminotransferase
MNERSTRMKQVQDPIIPIVGGWIRKHPGTISLGQGVVYYGPPPEAISAVQKFMAAGDNHKYQSVRGIDPLLEAIAAKLSSENGIFPDENRAQGNDRSRLCVTAGANMAFMNAVMAITEPDDEIILLSPFYFNHEMAVRIAGCQPVFVENNEDYQPDPDAVERAITEKTRAVVTISPNNPAGVVYAESTLRSINNLCRQRGIYHISDEPYEYFTYNSVRHFSPGSIAGSSDHTISMFSLSKAYGFASWRIGYMTFPERLEMSIKKIQDTILICPPVICQYAALGALQAGRAYCDARLSVTSEVREIILSELDRLGDMCRIPAADGAFYFLLKIDTRTPALDLAQRLVKEHGVAVIPGETFGMTDGCYLRVSYGPLQKETAAAGIGRLVKGLQQTARM